MFQNGFQILIGLLDLKGNLFKQGMLKNIEIHDVDKIYIYMKIHSHTHNLLSPSLSVCVCIYIYIYIYMHVWTHIVMDK